MMPQAKFCMKRLKFFLLIFVMSSQTSFGQVKEVFDPKTPIVWLGLDFTGAVFIGDREKFGSKNDIRYLISSWNSLMTMEKEKFDVYAMLGKTKVVHKVEIAQEHNDKLELTDITSNDLADRVRLTKEIIQDIVTSYDFSDLQGIGLMFNVENFNKLNNEAVVWITFINLETKSIIFTERVAAPPGGSGLRNYWAGAIFAIMRKIKAGSFEQWKRKYNK
jgi:hypothetical protein